MLASDKIRSNIEWKAWGDYDPMWGVSAVPGRNRKGSNPWTETEFYNFGRTDWALFSKYWQQYGVDHEACVEIGCGAGRMTTILAVVFQQVHALDISPGMIATAKRNVDQRRVQFHVTKGAEIPLPDSSLTAAFSSIVFQHFSQESVALQYFQEIYRCLKPGGTMMINLPLHNYPFNPWTGLMRLTYRMASVWQDMRANLRRFILRTPLRNSRVGRALGFYMHAKSYDYPTLYAHLSAIGFRDLEVRSFWVESEQRLHFFVFGRKG